MKAFTFNGLLKKGIELTTDEKLGQVVFLGEAGRGRRFEKIALDRRYPAEVRDGRVYEASVRKVTLPPRDGKLEKVFFVLEKPQCETEGVLVRVCTKGTYTRNTAGWWTSQEGAPETLVKGQGAYGDAGGIGTWDDGLVVIKPGDVLSVKPAGSHKTRASALYLKEGTLCVQDFEEWAAATKVEQVRENVASVELVLGSMPAFQFSRGEVKPGLMADPAKLAQNGLTLGSTSYRSRQVILPAVELVNPNTVAIAKSGTQLMLTSALEVEEGKVLVRVCTTGNYSRGALGTVGVLRGQPNKLAGGYVADGATSVDELWVLSAGDVLDIKVEGGYRYAMYLKDGQPFAERMYIWILRDARANPASYIAKGWCPTDRLPQEWVGKAVELYDEMQQNQRGPYALVSVSPEVTFDYGWADLKSQGNWTNPLYAGQVWAKLRQDLTVEAKAEVLEENEVVEFGDPPYDSGTQVRAHVTVTEEVVPASRYGVGGTRLDVRIVLPETPGAKYRVVKYNKGGKQGEEKTFAGEVKGTYVVPGYIASYAKNADGQPLAAGMDGEYIVEFFSSRRGPWGVKVLREAAQVNEPTVDVTIYMGKSARDASRLWVVGSDGSLIAEKSGSGTSTLKGIPASALVLRHQSSSYGYSNTEEWEIHQRPAQLTPAQLSKAQEIAGGLKHVYFRGEGTSWDFSLVGVVRYATPYYRDFRGAELEALRLMQAAYPVDVTEYEQARFRIPADQREYHRNVLRWMEVGPTKLEETSLSAAFKRAR